jgi:drug/metabolite transporter superfamily protein YnfA
MNKTVLVVSATLFGILGAYIPVLWGDNNLLSGWSILTSTVGGLFGIFVGVLISKRWL